MCYKLMSACFKDYDFGITQFVLSVYIATSVVVFILSRLLLIALSLLLLLLLLFVLVILLLLLSLNWYYLYVFTLISMLPLLLVYYRKLNLARLVT